MSHGATVSGYRGVKIDRSYDIAGLAGSSKNRKTVYIDRHMPEKITVENHSGEKVDYDPDHSLATHELDEREWMEKGRDYDAAHLKALKAEKKIVEGDRIKWNSYQEVMHKAVEGRKGTWDEKVAKPPPDLFVKGIYTGEREKAEEGAHEKNRFGR